MARDIDGGDLIRVVDPIGITTNAAWTWLAKIRLINGAVDGVGMVKVGPDNGTSTARGFYGFFRGTGSGNSPRVRIGALNVIGDIAITTGTWYNIAITRGGAGTAIVSLIVDGVVDQADNTDAPTEITTGDAYSVGYGDSGLGPAVSDLEIAMQAWLQGVVLSEGDTDTYIDDPCSLLTDYGPSGGVTANALKLFLMGAQDADISGVGQTISLTGGAEVAGPGGFPQSCGGGGGGDFVLLDRAHSAQHQHMIATAI